MAVKLRLKRMGAKQKPFYRIIAADSRSPRDGRFIETVGTYNPIKDPAIITLKEDRVMYWLEQGAIPTDTVRNILSKNKIMEKFDKEKAKAKKKTPKKETAKKTTTKKTTTKKTETKKEGK